MSLTEAQLRAAKKYHEKLDSITFRVQKGGKQTIQEHAQAQGESMNAFLCRAAKETMERDKEK